MSVKKQYIKICHMTKKCISIIMYLFMDNYGVKPYKWIWVDIIYFRI